MKKFLAVILAVIMALSVMPMAFAAEGTLDYSNLGVPYGQMYGYVESLYREGTKAHEEIAECYRNAMAEKIGKYDSIKNIWNLTENEKDIFDAFVADAYGAAEIIKEFVAEKGYTVVIDATDYGIMTYTMMFLEMTTDFGTFIRSAPEKTLSELEKMESEKEKLFASFTEKYGFEYYDAALFLNAEEIEKLNAALEVEVSAYNRLIDCYFGKHISETAKDNGDGTHCVACSWCGASTPAEEHIWGEYISSGDASCSKGETLTAICNLCGAEDVKVGETAKDKHTDEDEDNLCDGCGEPIIEICPFCKKEVEHKGYEQYICMMKNIINLLLAFIRMLVE